MDRYINWPGKNKWCNVIIIIRFLRDVETLEVLENRKLNIDVKESLGISHSYNENNTLEIYITDGTDKVLILDSELLLK